MRPAYTQGIRRRFRASEVWLLLGVIACNLGNLLRRLVLPVSIQSWSLTSLQQRLFKDRRAPHPACPVLRAPAGRGLLDREPLSADSPPHRATRGASDLIERTVRGESEARGGSIPAGVSLRSVVKGRGEANSRAGILKRSPCNLFRAGGTAASRACGALGGIRGRREWAISGIPRKTAPDHSSVKAHGRESARRR